MKLKNKILSIMMAVAATMSLVSISALAAAPSVNLTTDATTVKPGDTITVNVNIADNPGVCSTILSLSSDAELKLTGVTNGAIWGGATFDSDYKNPYQLTWFQDDTFATDDVDNGVAATLTYTVAETAVAGATYSINLVCDTGNTFNAAFEPIDFGSYTLNITIASDKPASSTEIAAAEAGADMFGQKTFVTKMTFKNQETNPQVVISLMDGETVVDTKTYDLPNVTGGDTNLIGIIRYMIGEGAKDPKVGNTFKLTVGGQEITTPVVAQ